MKTRFQTIFTNARIVNGKIDMITMAIPFELLPSGQRFRLGFEQDDFEYRKDNNIQRKLKIKGEKLVLVDLFYYYRCKKTNRFKKKSIS